jgi:hypothetical protein
VVNGHLPKNGAGPRGREDRGDRCLSDRADRLRAAGTAYLPVPPKILYVPCWLIVIRPAFGLKLCGPLPGECLTLKAPLRNTNLSTLLP